LEFLLTSSFRPHYSPGVDSPSNRYEYQEYFLWGKDRRFLKLTTLPLSYVDYLEIWVPQPSGTLRVCSDLYRACCTFVLQNLTLKIFKFPTESIQKFRRDAYKKQWIFTWTALLYCCF